MEADETQTEPVTQRRLTVPRTVGLVIGAILALLACMLLVGLVYWMNQPRPLKPVRVTVTSAEFYINREPELVTFTELNENAAAYQNKFIRITGHYFPQKLPDCAPYSGPVFRSVLVSDELQLDMLGGEAALRIVPVNTKLTVDGIWRKFEGPVGCGKEPPRQTLWYLELTNIVAPNPIMGLTTATPAGVEPPVGGLPLPTTTPTSAVNVPTPTQTPSLAMTAVPTATPIDDSLTPTRPAVVTVTPLPTGTGTAVFPTPPTNTPTPGFTGTPGSSPTPMPTVNTIGTPAASPTPPPPLGTSTPGTPYPGPGATLTPTTESGY